MITEQEAEAVVERLVRRVEQGNAFFLKNIGQSVKKLRELTPSEAQKLVQILKYGGNYEEIVRELAKYTNLNIEDIDKIFSAYAEKDLNFAEQFYNYRDVPFVPYDQNETLIRQTQALAEIVKKEVYNFSRNNVLGYTLKDLNGVTQFYGLKETYNRVLDEALLNVGQGKETFDVAMKRIMKEIGGSGLKTIEYESGRAVRLDSSVRMHLKDRLRELHNENQKLFGQQFGADGVEITVHGNPAPDHAPVQGRQFSNEEFEKLQNGEDATDYKGVIYNLDHDGKYGHRPISAMNCYHVFFNIVLGVSQPQYTDEQLDKIVEDNEKGFEYNGKHYTNYEGTQLQRKIERAIREQKDIQTLAKNSGNEALAGECDEKIQALTDKYYELSKVSKLPTKLERINVEGYRKVANVQAPTQKPISKQYYDFEQLGLDDDIYLDYFGEFAEKDIKDLKLTEEQKDAYKYFYDFDTFENNEDIKEAIEDYTDVNAEYNYNKINWALRNDKMTPEIQERVDLITEGINQNKLPNNMVVYRGITGEDKIKEYLKVGGVVEEKGFLSTSISKDVADEIADDIHSAVLEIEVDKGTPSIYIGEQTMSLKPEEEILFDKNAKLETISVDKLDENRKKIKVKMLK